MLTFIGEPSLWPFIAAILVLVFFFIRKRWRNESSFLKRFLLIMIPSLAIALILAFLLKEAFPIARPCIPCTMIQDVCNPYCPANDTSFPSGHATTIFAVLTSLWLVQRKRWQLPIFILAIAVASSRVLLGVHTWTDVIAGSILGLAVSLLVWYCLERRGFLNQKRRTATNR